MLVTRLGKVVYHLHIAHLNIRSNLHKLKDILLLMNEDQMALSETFIDDTMSDVEICPNGSGLSIVRMTEIGEEVDLLSFY